MKKLVVSRMQRVGNSKYKQAEGNRQKEQPIQFYVLRDHPPYSRAVLTKITAVCVYFILRTSYFALARGEIRIHSLTYSLIHLSGRLFRFTIDDSRLTIAEEKGLFAFPSHL